eukprot:TRINITY_DN12950_c0_g1_i1.p1 TRINITY_DN12950_c0_g1~~TRINITY_DN12950_c0_g1_i1.p1  ORF type:complete len:556 (+),score=81.50 TRINITY_DN12950_c0_g1_i1:77-1669(+)
MSISVGVDATFLLAVQKSDRVECDKQLELGASINALDQYGQSPLHYAARNGSVEMCQYLLDCGADPNTKLLSGRQSMTVLHYAAAAGQVPIIGMLIRHGADVKATDEAGRTPFDWASHHSHTAAASVLQAAMADQRNALHIAAQLGDVAMLRKLFRLNTLNVNAREGNGMTPLHYAASTGQLLAAQMLIEHGAEITSRDNAGRSSLDWAQHRGFLAVCAILKGEKVPDTADAVRVLSAGEADRCCLAGCARPRYQQHPFCCAQHATEASQRGRCLFPGCALSRAKEGIVLHDYCSSIHAQAAVLVDHPTVQVLESCSERYRDVEKQFVEKWTKTAYGTPHVVSIAQVSLSAQVARAFVEHRAVLCSRVPPIRIFKNGGPGNEQRRFHGTGMQCQLGMPGHETLCDDSECAACSIIRNGFKLEKFGTGTGTWGRFGKGHYFTSTSSKTHDYNVKSKAGLPPGHRMTMMCQVLIGNGHKMETGDSKLMEPPSGFDSVLGEVGSELNFDELCVYSDAACLPKYLVIYTGGVDA